RVWEPVKSNNLALAVPFEIVYREADLSIDFATTPADADSGGFFTINYGATNVGERATRDTDWYDRVYLSRDGSLDTADKLIGTFKHSGALDPGESYESVLEARLPDN